MDLWPPSSLLRNTDNNNSLLTPSFILSISVRLKGPSFQQPDLILSFLMNRNKNNFVLLPPNNKDKKFDNVVTFRSPPAKFEGGEKSN